jgi:hypothetical protein
VKYESLGEPGAGDELPPRPSARSTVGGRTRSSRSTLRFRRQSLSFAFGINERIEMIRISVIGAILCLLAVGCDRPSSQSFAKFNLDGGRYFVEIENTEGGTSSIFQSTGEGTNVIEERYDISWGSSHRLQIENGNLNVNGVDRGRLQPGDRIVIVEGSDEVLVNGTKR